MKKQKLHAIETCLQLHMMKAKPLYDKESGESLPYLVTANGEVYRYPSTKVMPYLDSQSGAMYITLWYRCEQHTYPLAQLIAEAYIPRPEGTNAVVLKSGDKTDIKNYRVDNIEWSTQTAEIESNAESAIVADKLKEERKPYGFIGNDKVKLAKFCWCRAVQLFKVEDIARFFDIDPSEVEGLISSVSSYMESVFFIKPTIPSPKITKSIENNKLREIRDFTIYLINCNGDLTNRQIADSLMPIICIKNIDKVTRRVQEIRREDKNVFDDCRLKK